MVPDTPHLSVVIPVKNGGDNFKLCLQGLLSSTYKNYELIVVDDGSTDNSIRIAESHSAIIYKSSDHVISHREDFPFQNSIGPGGARNIGVSHAKGAIIFFIDSDVIPRPDALQRVVDFFDNNPHYSAVFGTYDDAPADKCFISQFRNLLHHYVHLTSSTEAQTFWTGCGAIRKEAFLKINGFDCSRFRLPSVEDIDLGYRLRDNGLKIFLDKNLQGKHLKNWTFKTMLKTDIFQRAIPWLRILFDRKRLPNDLNLQTPHRISGGLMLGCFCLVILFLVNLIFKPTGLSMPQKPAISLYSFTPPFLLSIGSLFIIAVAINVKMYLYFFGKKGFFFMLKSIPLHMFYYLYSTLVFIVFLTDNRIPLFRYLRKKIGVITHT